MATRKMPFTPIRWELYTPKDLFEGFKPERPASFARTPDFRIYRHFVMHGRSTPGSHFIAMMQALHDNSITEALQRARKGRRIVGIMGAHEAERGDPTYRAVATLARELTRARFLVCTGGGPGAMEAAHLGAAHAGVEDERLDEAIRVLSRRKKAPNLSRIVADDGAVDMGRVAKAHRWFRPAWEIAAALSDKDKGESLAVPTWQYGSEPSTPFATMIAKYFQNSIREDGLLAIARRGVVFAPGTAGTVQEIFQNAAQNKYKTFGRFAPMIFFGREYWTEEVPVRALLRRLFKNHDYATHIHYTDSVGAVIRFIARRRR